MQSKPRFFACLLLGGTGILSALFPLRGLASAAPREAVEFFEEKIRPVLVSQCYECHASDSKKVKGGLLLDTREGLLRGGESGPALVPGKAAESMLVAALKHENLEMPPKKKLSEEVVGDFVRWIERGAVDPRLEAAPVAAVGKGVDMEKARKHWAFVPPVRGPLPSVQRKEWPRGEVDFHILAALEARQLRPVVPAGKRELLRRANRGVSGG
jgi:Planctomycete cytochrome C